MSIEINNMNDFRIWVEVELARRQTTKQNIAKEMQIAYPRLSEAVHGQPSGVKYREPLIKALGGDTELFRNVLKDDKSKAEKRRNAK